MTLPIDVVKTPLGVEAWVVTDNTVPVVAFNVAFLGGGVQDPDGKEGLASFTASLMTEGAGGLDSQAFKKKLESLAASIDCSASYDFLFCGAHMLAFNKEKVFALLKDVLVRPRFGNEDIERMRLRYHSLVNAHEEDPQWLAARALYDAVAPHHPYARALDGTHASLDNITREDIVKYRGHVIGRDNVFITVVGPMTSKEVQDALDDIFGEVPTYSVLRTVPLTTPRGGKEKKVFIPNPQAVAAFVLPAPDCLSPDYMPASVLNYTLGGGDFSSRLMDEIREKRGLAYYAYTRLVERRSMPVFFGGVGTKQERIKDSLDIVREQINDIAKNGITQQELEDAQSYLTGSFPLGFDSNSATASRLLGIRINGLGVDYVEKYARLVREVNLESVKRVASMYFDQALSFGIAGDFRQGRGDQDPSRQEISHVGVPAS